MTYIAVKLQTALEALRAREEGQTFVEYALIIAFVAIVVVAGLTVLGNELRDAFSDIGSWVDSSINVPS